MAKKMSAERRKLMDAVIRFQQGDENSFSEIYQLTLPFAYSCIHKLVKTPAVMCHVIEVTYNMVYESIGELNRPENTKTWIGRLIVHNTIEWMMKHWENYPLLKELEGTEDQIKEKKLEVEWLSIEDEKIPSLLIEDVDNKGYLKDKLRSMDLVYRVIYVELFMNQMTEAAVIKELGVSEMCFQYLLEKFLGELHEFYEKHEMLPDLPLRSSLIRFLNLDVKDIRIPSLIRHQLDADIDAQVGEDVSFEDHVVPDEDKITKESMEEYVNSGKSKEDAEKIDDTISEVIQGFGDKRAARKKLKKQMKMNKKEQKKLLGALIAIIVAIILISGLAIFYDRISDRDKAVQAMEEFQDDAADDEGASEEELQEK